MISCLFPKEPIAVFSVNSSIRMFYIEYFCGSTRQMPNEKYTSQVGFSVGLGENGRGGLSVRFISMVLLARVQVAANSKPLKYKVL